MRVEGDIYAVPFQLPVTCSKAESGNNSPVLVKLHQALIKLDVMYNDSTTLQAYCYHINSRRLKENVLTRLREVFLKILLCKKDNNSN